MRADASGEIGTGHLRRCMALADALLALGAEPRFVIRRHDYVAPHVMASSGYPVTWLPAAQETLAADTVADDPPHAAWAGVAWDRDATETVASLRDEAPDWMIVDHYAFDARWHAAVRNGLGCRLMAIDDLGDRSLAADLLLDANVARSHDDKYAGRLSPHTRMLAGPRFALLSQAYRNASRYVFSPQVRSIGVFMGGTDAAGVSADVVRALRQDAGFRGAVEVVSTSANPGLEDMAGFCAQDSDVTLSVDLSDLSAFYARHDLQIGAGGTASYERCCIGVPTVAVTLAANQLAVVPVLAELEVVRAATINEMAPIGLSVKVPDVGAVVRDLVDHPEERRRLSDNARRVVDGCGAERVALVLAADRLEVRAATLDDANVLHRWRNHSATRAVSINTAEIAYADHLRWMTEVIDDPTRRLFVATVETVPVGAIRFDLLDDDTWEISLYTNPILHGLGLGTRMLLAGEAAMVERLASTTTFQARITAGNEISTKMFERVGYRGSDGCLTKIRYQGDAA